MVSYLALVPNAVLNKLRSPSGGIYTACQVGSNLTVAIKKGDLGKQPEDIIINELLVMRERGEIQRKERLKTELCHSGCTYKMRTAVGTHKTFQFRLQFQPRS